MWLPMNTQWRKHEVWIFSFLFTVSYNKYCLHYLDIILGYESTIKLMPTILWLSYNNKVTTLEN